jgi:transcription-repair coupling factor (superfamily II helicase)
MVKWIAVKLGMEKILLKNNLLIANFISDPKSPFYRSQTFVSIMNYVNRHQKQMSVRQKEAKLSMTITGIKSVSSAIVVLKDIQEKIFTLVV